jgi:hypothetical protein
MGMFLYKATFIPDLNGHVIKGPMGAWHCSALSHQLPKTCVTISGAPLSISIYTREENHVVINCKGPSVQAPYVCPDYRLYTPERVVLLENEVGSVHD